MHFHAHFAPSAGWMNDPNGLIDVDGTHHLFFQHDPDSTTDGPAGGRIRWGHAVSTDFVHWRQLPAALHPGDAGDYDRDGCYSGCAVRRDDGGVAVLYSGHRAGADLPCLACSEDPELLSWTKHPTNPVIAERPPIDGITDFRDHSITRRGDIWEQHIAAGGAQGGMIVTYTSTDLEHWRYDGILLAGRDDDLPGDHWECPDVFEVGETTVVIVSWYSAIDRGTIWVTGTRDTSGFAPQRWGDLDRGGLVYAPQSYTADDGRRIMFGWLVTAKDPSAAGRPSMGAQSLPRSLSVRDGRLTQEPAREITALSGPAVAEASVDDRARISLEPLEALQITVTGKDLANTARLVLLAPDGRARTVPVATLDETPYHERDHRAWAARTSAVGALRVVFDRGLIEVFSDDGRAVTVCDLALTSVSGLDVRRLGDGPDPLEVAVSALDAD